MSTSSAHKSVKFDVQPQSLDFTVKHGSVQLHTQFQVCTEKLEMQIFLLQQISDANFLLLETYFN